MVEDKNKQRHKMYRVKYYNIYNKRIQYVYSSYKRRVTREERQWLKANINHFLDIKRVFKKVEKPNLYFLDRVISDHKKNYQKMIENMIIELHVNTSRYVKEPTVMSVYECSLCGEKVRDRMIDHRYIEEYNKGFLPLQLGCTKCIPCGNTRRWSKFELMAYYSDMIHDGEILNGFSYKADSDFEFTDKEKKWIEMMINGRDYPDNFYDVIEKKVILVDPNGEEYKFVKIDAYKKLCPITYLRKFMCYRDNYRDVIEIMTVFADSMEEAQEKANDGDYDDIEEELTDCYGEAGEIYRTEEVEYDE